jgi:hypothetical protein
LAVVKELRARPDSCNAHRDDILRKEQDMVKNTAVMGIYPDRTTVSDAVDVLRKAGYRATDVSVLASDNQGTKDFAIEKRTRALEAAAAGAAVGAAVGTAIAWFICIQGVTFAGSAPLVAAGPVLGGAAGAGAGGALGWIAGLVAGLWLPEYVAKRYAGRIRRGGILLSVHCDSEEWCDKAKQTLKATGARSISAARESAADYGTTDKPTERAPSTAAKAAETPVQQAPGRAVHKAKA